MISPQNAAVLIRYVNALEEASNRLEDAYYKKNKEEFENMKKFILGIKSKIDEILR